MRGWLGVRSKKKLLQKMPYETNRLTRQTRGVDGVADGRAGALVTLHVTPDHMAGFQSFHCLHQPLDVAKTPFHSLLRVALAKNLSVNNIDGQHDLAQRNDGRRKMVERQKGVLELFVAHQQLAKAVEPAVARLDHPAARLLLRVFPLLLSFALAADHMRDVAVRQNHLHRLVATVARIGAQVFVTALFGRGSFDDDGLKHRLDLRHIVHVGPGDDQRQRDATPVHQQVALAPIFFPDPWGWAPQLPVPGAP